MGYLHINNLYKDQNILMFKECWALEKVHGTSAHIKFDANGIHYFSGGEKLERFKSLFNEPELMAKRNTIQAPIFTVYGEAYGGSQQGMSDTYGKELKFIVFDILMGNEESGHWLDVPNMAEVANILGLEVTPFEKVKTDIEVLDALRDRPSEVAIRRGMGENKLREGIVLRPLIELRTNQDARIIVKHKGDAFKETSTSRKVLDADKLVILAEANAIADEWVTPMRLGHVLDKNPECKEMKDIPKVIMAMVEDVMREAAGEIVASKEAVAAIKTKAASLFKEKVKRV